MNFDAKRCKPKRHLLNVVDFSGNSREFPSMNLVVPKAQARAADSDNRYAAQRELRSTVTAGLFAHPAGVSDLPIHQPQSPRLAGRGSARVLRAVSHAVVSVDPQEPDSHQRDLGPDRRGGADGRTRHRPRLRAAVDSRAGQTHRPARPRGVGAGGVPLQFIHHAGAVGSHRRPAGAVDDGGADRHLRAAVQHRRRLAHDAWHAARFCR